ncbi:MAG TPA: DUF1592 domain-containing protein [Polyangiaceae bacterium]|nr:DUF1592 domain-containing protein [Polyangiaceae bacterium]
MPAKPLRHGLRFWARPLVALFLAACSGAGGASGGDKSHAAAASGAGGGGTPPGSSGDSAAAASGSGTAGPSVASGAFVPGPAFLRRLTTTQYWNSIDDLLGPGAPRSNIDPDQPNGGFAAIGASVVATSPTGVAQYETAALGASEWAFADPARRSALAACPAGTAAGAACAQAFVSRFLGLAFRRLPTAAENARYMVLVTGAPDVWTGMQQAVAAALQSPKFLYRLELGSPAAGTTGPNQLSGYELASRLSYLLWDSTPDAALLDAAGQGTLGTSAGVSAQVMRMVSLPRARTGVSEFFSEALNLQDLSVLNDSALAADMHQETLLLVDDIVFGRNADLQELLSSTSTFVNQNLATYYGLAAPASPGFGKVSLPTTGTRVGFLGQGSFLVATSALNHPSATLRGKFVRESLLCQSVPPPPPNVNTTLVPASATMPMTTRQQLTMHRADPTCAACHAFMDPIGLAFDNFDWQAKFRDQEFGLPIDPSGDLDGQKFANARELALLLAQREDVSRCTVRKLYRVAVGHEESAGEEPAITGLANGFAASGHRLIALVTSLATSDAFRWVSASP